MPLLKADEKRNRLVDRVVRFLPAKKVRIPHRVGVIAAVHRAGFVAETEITLLGRHSLPGVDVRAVPSHRQGRLVGKKNIACRVRESDQQRRFLDDDNDAAHRHAQLGLAIFDVDRRRLRRLDHRPGKIFGKGTLRREANANHAVAKSCNAHFCGTGGQFDAVLKFLHALHVSDMLPARRRSAGAADRAEEQADSGPTGKTRHVVPPCAELVEEASTRIRLRAGRRALDLSLCREPFLKKGRRLWRLQCADAPRP